MILAIKTAGSKAELYLLDQAAKPLSSETWEAGRELSAQILIKIEQLLKKSKIGFDGLSAIVVFQGPGSFTSLRIGISVANTMAYALSIPIVGSNAKNWLSQGVKALATAKTGKFVLP